MMADIATCTVLDAYIVDNETIHLSNTLPHAGKGIAHSNIQNVTHKPTHL
jgi:hypothetical protein